MGIFDFLFGKKEDTSAAEGGNASKPSRGMASTLTYDPKMINGLTEDHRSLLVLFGAITEAQQTGDFATVKKLLGEFLVALNMHLVVENSKFYAYLRKRLPHGSREHETMTAFWDEMQGIGKVVTQFLRKHIDCDFTPEVQATFSSELAQIGAALVSRIEREEKDLYGLYVP